MKQRVKTAKGRSTSSVNWLKRQINDRFVKKSAQEGYRSRSAYKLIEINKKFCIIKPKDKVLDLGSSPGGWSQVASKLVGKEGKVFALDKEKMEPIDGVKFFQYELCTNPTTQIDQEILDTRFDSVISDIAPSSIGNATIDSIKSTEIVKLVIQFAKRLLKGQGSIAIKIMRGSQDEQELFHDLKKEFSYVKYFKPSSSRKESREIYLIIKQPKQPL